MHLQPPHASIFAQGAIQLLDAAGCSAFCFGSEDGKIEPFENSLASSNRLGMNTSKP